MSRFRRVLGVTESLFYVWLHPNKLRIALFRSRRIVLLRSNWHISLIVAAFLRDFVVGGPAVGALPIHLVARKKIQSNVNLISNRKCQRAHSLSLCELHSAPDFRYPGVTTIPVTTSTQSAGSKVQIRILMFVLLETNFRPYVLLAYARANRRLLIDNRVTTKRCQQPV